MAVAAAAPPVPPAVLATKLSVPPLRRNAVPRPRLLEQLRAGLAGKLTLVAAPAGFGKTTLVAAWCAAGDGQAVPAAWVALDAGDNDSGRFWTHVLAAAGGLGPGVGELALSLLTAPQPSPIEAVLIALVNDLARLPGDVIVVL